MKNYMGLKPAFLSALAICLLSGAALFLLDRQRPAATEAPNPAPPAAEPAETRLFFAGDIMLSRNVGTRMIAADDFLLPYRQTAGLTKNADLSFANLESPFHPTAERVTEGLVFKAEPAAVRGLAFAGFDVLSTANNHSFDMGLEGIDYTRRLLLENGIQPAGTGTDCRQGTVMRANGLRFGFLAYSYAAYNDGGAKPDPHVCDWNDSAQVAADIAALRPKVDFLIVSAHMGLEYKREPEAANAQKARAAVDAGADLFIGHHPHWIQTVEQYKGKYIFYSLGNFIFDQMWSQDTREGLAVSVLFKGKNLSKIELHPVVIENYCCPRWANELETKTILSKINLTSPVLFDKN